MFPKLPKLYYHRVRTALLYGITVYMTLAWSIVKNFSMLEVDNMSEKTVLGVIGEQ